DGRSLRSAREPGPRAGRPDTGAASREPAGTVRARASSGQVGTSGGLVLPGGDSDRQQPGGAQSSGSHRSELLSGAVVLGRGSARDGLPGTTLAARTAAMSSNAAASARPKE